MLLDLISGGDPDETSLLWRLAGYRARKLAEVQWPSIEKAAAALLERRELTEAEVLEVLRRCPRVAVGLHSPG